MAQYSRRNKINLRIYSFVYERLIFHNLSYMTMNILLTRKFPSQGETENDFLSAASCFRMLRPLFL